MAKTIFDLNPKVWDLHSTHSNLGLVLASITFGPNLDVGGLNYNTGQHFVYIYIYIYYNHPDP